MRHSAFPALRPSFSLASIRSSLRSSSRDSNTRSRTTSAASTLTWNPHDTFAPPSTSASTSSSADTADDLPALPYNPLLSHPPRQHQRKHQRQPSPAATVRSILSRQASLVDLEMEQRDFGTEIGVLEPRPVVFWQGVEQRMGF